MRRVPSYYNLNVDSVIGEVEMQIISMLPFLWFSDFTAAIFEE